MNDKQQLAAMGEHMLEMEECKPEFKVPDGWKLVPVKITDSMFDAALDCADACGGFPEIWGEMLAAAPEYKP